MVARLQPQMDFAPMDLLNQRDIEFLLYEWLDVASVTARERFADHDNTSFNAILDTARRIASERFAPIRRLCDLQQPQFNGRDVQLPLQIGEAIRVYIDSGLLAATQDYADGGLQLPQTIAAVANAYFAAANFGVYGYPYLTAAAADLIRAHGSNTQKAQWLQPLLSGRYFGTMALTEPGAGSALADLTTTATQSDDGSYQFLFPVAIMRCRKISCIWYWRVSKARQRVSKAFRCLSARNFCSMPMVIRRHATMCSWAVFFTRWVGARIRRHI